MPETHAVKDPICDFCSTPDPVWEYPAQDFDDPFLKTRSLGEWKACDECAACIERNEWDKLAHRALLAPGVQRAVADLGKNIALREVVRVHAEFNRYRTGQVKRIRGKLIN